MGGRGGHTFVFDGWKRSNIGFIHATVGERGHCFHDMGGKGPHICVIQWVEENNQTCCFQKVKLVVFPSILISVRAAAVVPFLFWHEEHVLCFTLCSVIVSSGAPRAQRPPSPVHSCTRSTCREKISGRCLCICEFSIRV